MVESAGLGHLGKGDPGAQNSACEGPGVGCACVSEEWPHCPSARSEVHPPSTQFESYFTILTSRRGTLGSERGSDLPRVTQPGNARLRRGVFVLTGALCI